MRAHAYAAVALCLAVCAGVAGATDSVTWTLYDSGSQFYGSGSIGHGGPLTSQEACQAAQSVAHNAHFGCVVGTSGSHYTDSSTTWSPTTDGATNSAVCQYYGYYLDVDPGCHSYTLNTQWSLGLVYHHTVTACPSAGTSFGMLTQPPSGDSNFGGTFCDNVSNVDCEVQATGGMTLSAGTTTSPTREFIYTGQHCQTQTPPPAASGDTPQSEKCVTVNGEQICAEKANCGKVNGQQMCLDPAKAGTCSALTNGGVFCVSDSTHPEPAPSPNSAAGAPDAGVPGGAAATPTVKMTDTLTGSPGQTSQLTGNYYPPGAAQSSCNYGQCTGSCGGTGQPSCTQCGGSGQPTCSTCGHDGQPACSNCGSPGQPACGSCGGAGQPVCGNVGGGADCGTQPTCTSEDPAECAVVYQAWVIHCEAAQPNHADIQADVAEAHAAAGGIPTGFGLGTGGTVNVASWFTSQSPNSCAVADINFQVWGQVVTVPLSGWCGVLLVTGLLVLAGAGVISARIIAGGVS